MANVRITIEEYNQLLKIAYCTETYLDTSDELTKKRLKEYIKEFKNQ